MITVDTKHTTGHDDFELNIPRKQLLTYHIAYDDEKEVEGIIFIIPGFGDDASVGYQKNLIKYIAEKYNLLAVFVEYHALFARLSDDKESASYQFGRNDTELLIKYLEMLDIKLDENNLEYLNIVETIDQRIQKLKSINELDYDFKLDMWGTVCPYKDEYQNFGVLQAVDILTVLCDLKALGYEKIINEKPIIALGSSHGGYIANLAMKFAPNTFDTIIDNSCYTKPPLNYIIGIETNPHFPEFMKFYRNIKMHLFTLTNWSSEKNDYNFSQAFYNIRDLTNNDQIKQLAMYATKTKIISYNSEYDKIGNYSDKKEYIESLIKNKYQCVLNTISSTDQIDGRLIKNLEHSMGMSIKALIDKEVPNLLNKKLSENMTDICLESTIEYDVGDNRKFIFDFNKTGLAAKVIEVK